MKQIMKYLTVPTALILLSGCASSLSTPVPGGKVVHAQNGDASYIIFSRPEFVGAALSNTIVEFDPNTHSTKYIGTLGPQTRLAYKTTAGTHYFYMDGGENDDMIKINTGKSKEYYVHTAVGMGVVAGRFYFEPLRYPSLALAESLKGGDCSKSSLSKYGFKAVKDEVSELTGVHKYTSAQHNVNIECKNNVIKKSSYDGQSLSDINDAKLIQSNAEGTKFYNEHVVNYIKEIKEDFSDWRRDDMSKTAMRVEDGKSLK